MAIDNPTIIAERSLGAGARRAVWQSGALVALIGVAAAVYYAAADLTLSHYDARAHLVVGRRVIDSLTPGWRQFGAVWLPLPHLLNALPVQWDWAYRSGATGVFISIVAMSCGAAALSAFLARHSGSIVVAIAVPLALALNPNVLYLQSTPMTEPLLIGLALVAVNATDRWVRSGGMQSGRLAGWSLAGLVLTRYEGWLIAGALLAIALLARGRDVVRLARAPTVALAAFLLLARGSTGAWFVASGFFVADNPSAGDVWAVLNDVRLSTLELAGAPVLWAGSAGVLTCLWRARRTRAALIPLAVLCAGALPCVAFYQGHPHRVRYMVPIVAALVVLAGAAVAALPRRVRVASALTLLAATIWVRPPLDPGAPMVLEAQWETPWRLDRQHVTTALLAVHDGTPILASMGSLGHYMQEVAAARLTIRDFVHEGNGDLWADALRWPHRHVRWILIEERAEGGDMLAGRAREDPAFLAGFTRVIDAGGLVLYQRR